MNSRKLKDNLIKRPHHEVARKHITDHDNYTQNNNKSVNQILKN